MNAKYHALAAQDEYTIDDERGIAYCNYCPTVIRRGTDPMGLIVAINHHIDRKH